MTDSKLTGDDRLETAIARLRQLTQIDVQTDWRYCAEDLSIDVAIESDISNWRSVTLNSKNHIAWDAGKKVFWLKQLLIIPDNLYSYPLTGLALRLSLRWWAELAQIFVNGSLVQEGDLFDCFTRILLSPCVLPGDEINIALRLVSPGHDPGALVHSLCIYEYDWKKDLTPQPPSLQGKGEQSGLRAGGERLEPGFIADELAVLQKYLEVFEPDKLEILIEAVKEINWQALPENVAEFDRSLFLLRQTLQSKIRSPLPPLKSGCKSRRGSLAVQLAPSRGGNPKSKIHLLGHAHLDMAWLWTVSETWEAAQRTFTSAIQLIKEFPELTFCHSTPALYQWIEQHRPDLFAAIKQQVIAGKWEVVGGMWIEPEFNCVSGESIVRQILYGQLYVKEKFGQFSTVAWLPDSFGFCWQLPQMLKQGGIEYFVTQKLLWNDTTQFPYGLFYWQAPDGTQILSLMSAPIGEGIEPVKMAKYACDWYGKTGLKDYLWLPGVGDHGGGPTRDMLEVARRWQTSPFFPDLEFTTASNYLQEIQPENSSCLPVWNDELYLEFHRGCYTSHADQKRFNRQSEGLLYQAELFASLATIATGITYPQSELETAWKKVLFNQFHDILPGSAIRQVYVEADRDWQEVQQTATAILQQSFQAIASQIQLPDPPVPDAQAIIVFNPTNWPRSEVVSFQLPQPKYNWQPQLDWQIRNLKGKEVLICNINSVSPTIANISFLAEDIPGVGYKLFWLCPHKNNNYHSLHVIDFVIENRYLRVSINPNTGDIDSIFDKDNNREILSAPSNQLQAFEDGGQYWDAWNIDPNYERHPLPTSQLLKIQHCCDLDSVESRIRVTRKIGRSTFYQDYVLEAWSKVIKIETKVDWQETHVLVKAAFSLNLEADYVAYEIPYGARKQTTKPQTPAEKAKWEIPALQWADLSNDEWGVSLLNDCKYGYDFRSNCLRLTLLRSSTWPDPEADKGWHEFTYAIYPHSGSWETAGTVRRGYELNLPLQVWQHSSTQNPTSPKLPPAGQLLNLTADNLILTAFKRSQNDPQTWILRCYECHGTAAMLGLHSDLDLKVTQRVDLLEQPIDRIPESEFDRSPDVQPNLALALACALARIAPWQIATFTVINELGNS
ncbi:MAG: alpha-mannosidase [Cyanosarcina radialis HA8281-LM2]|jgi:alpha-mannosidase|nr:alpha-mannosidase [Cyanosarcina radialis HA8281-LM2]